jgi:hypothetical protein
VHDLSTAPLDDDLTPPGGVDVAGRLVTWTAAGPLVQASLDLGPPEDVGPGELSRAAFPGPVIAWQLREPDGVHVQEATRG